MRSSRIVLATLALCSVAAFSLNAQEPAGGGSDSRSFMDHVTAAKLLADGDMAGRNLLDCSMPPVSAAPTGTPLVAPPTRVFDQLYYLGTNRVATWALVTSDGIIQIDSMNDADEAERFIVGGYKQLGLDPAQMKYLILTHGHSDHFGGAKYLQETYHPRVLMAAVDWDMVAVGAKDPKFPRPPARDMDIADGQKLTLAKTTITFYSTPGHTPGTISMLIPVTDRGAPHLLSFWGGSAIPRALEPNNNPGRGDSGIITYRDSLARFIQLGEEAGADGYIANHPYRDLTFIDGKDDKITMNAARKAGDPSPWIGRSDYIRYMMIALECVEAQMGWVQAGRPKVEP